MSDNRAVRPELAAMLEAGSVAVVGASSRHGSVGAQMLHQLVAGGFEGAVYPVNPKYEELLGRRCYPSLEDLPEPVDLVLLGVPNAALEEQLLAAARAGARSAVIFASAYEEPGISGAPSLTERLAAIAGEAGMALCGANCMGFVNVEHRLRALAFAEREDLEPGPITWLSHSGSAFSALLHNDRRLRFNLAVSAGQELVTTIADYMRYGLDLSSTRVLAVFLETVRDPAGFLAALDRAAERDVPVVAVKVGRDARAREMVEAHSGALAGDDGAYEAVFESRGVIRVRTMDEMADTLELLSAGRRPRPGGLASMHDSGGERAHLIDVAAETGVPLADISAETTARLASVLEPGLPAVNPLDAWGTGREYERIFLECGRALLDDPGTAALAFAVDLSGEDLEPGYERVALELLRSAEAPVAVLCNLASATAPEAAARLREQRVPVLEGTATGLAAFGHSFHHRDWRALPPLAPPSPVSPETQSRWMGRFASGMPWAEAEGLELLAEYGIDAIPTIPVSTLDEAMNAGRRVGYPAALKTAAGAGHKTEAGGVRLGLRNESELSDAYAELAKTLGPAVVVQPMAPRGVELALGIVRDQQFGPLVMVAAGGTLIEVLKDRRLAMPPLDEPRARRLLDRLAVRPLLEGVRGSESADVDAVVRALVRLSRLALDLGEELDALDVNPLVAGPRGCVAVDALVLSRIKTASP